MTSSLIDTFVPASTYNTLPTISEVADVPICHAQDLADLRDLLKKHCVPQSVTIRLIHKHFDAIDDEVMVFETVPIPGYSSARIMKPVVPQDKNQFVGIHYFVNDAAMLQAYEYGNFEVPDMTDYGSFLADFCKLVSQRGLQHKFGLKIYHEEEEKGWTEYEFPSKRSTIMFPEDMSMPSGEVDFTVNTEWIADGPRTRGCKHCKHCGRHFSHQDDCGESGFCLGGQHTIPGSELHDIVSKIVTVF